MKFKRLTFNQFKLVCLNDLTNFVKEVEKGNKTPKSEIEEKLKEIKSEFKSITCYDDLRGIYGYYGLSEFEILQNLVKI